MEHSPTPWKVEDVEFSMLCVTDAMGEDVAGWEASPDTLGPCRADAARIVACVNGCAEIPEPGDLPAMLTHVRGVCADTAAHPDARTLARLVLEQLGVPL